MIFKRLTSTSLDASAWIPIGFMAAAMGIMMFIQHHIALELDGAQAQRDRLETIMKNGQAQRDRLERLLKEEKCPA